MWVRWRTIVIFLAILFLSNSSAQVISYTGQCQAQCLSEYSKHKDRTLLNGDTVLNEIDVTNDTSDFSFCKLGCSSPEINYIGLSSFIAGQKFMKTIASKTDEVIPTTVVSRVVFLCVDYSSRNRSLSSQIELEMPNGAHEKYVHFVEAFYKSADGTKKESSFWSKFYYSRSINMHTELPEDLTSFQLSVTTFSATGIMGNTVKSTWVGIQIIESAAKSEVIVAAKKQMLVDEQVSVELSLSSPPDNLPACSLTISYGQHLSESRKSIRLDRSMGYLLNGLSFEHEYKISAVPTVLESMETPKESLIKTATCRQLAKDHNSCAPPPVDNMVLLWTTAETAILNWTYGGDMIESLRVRHARMIHFSIVIRPIATPDYDQCREVADQTRSVPGLHRSIVFYVTDITCNYETEITVVDSRNRRSPSRKSQFIRMQKKNDFISGVANGDTVQVIILIMMLSLILVSVSAFIIICEKSRRLNNLQKSIDSVTHSKVIVSGTSVGSTYIDSFDSDQISRHFDGLKGAHMDVESQRRWTFNGKQRPRTTIIPRPHSVDNSATSRFTRWSSERVVNSMSDSSNLSNGARMDIDGYTYCLDERPLDECGPSVHCSIMALADTSLRRILKTDIVVRELLGNGRYGITSLVSPKRNERLVVVLKESYGVDEEECKLARDALKRELVSAQELCRTDRTQCLVQILGVATILDSRVNEAISGLLFEYCVGGDLLKVLDSCAQVKSKNLIDTHGTTNIYEEVYDCSDAEARRSLATVLIQCAYDIAFALNFISNCQYVHRDIAARNVMLTMSWSTPIQPNGQRAKLGDFGLCGHVSENKFDDEDTKAYLPTNILPPEAFDRQQYELSGDVWEFGCLLAEMCSLGKPCSIRSFEREGRQERLTNFIDGITSNDKQLDARLIHILRPIITACLCIEPSERPSPEKILLELEHICTVSPQSPESEYV